MTILWPYLVYLGVGLISGFLAGLLGVGGGIVIVPLLSWLFYLEGMHDSIIMHVAIGTSLAAMIFTTYTSLRAHAQHGNAPYSLLKRILPSTILGVAGGVMLAQYLSTVSLEIFFAIFLFIVGIWMISGIQPKVGRELPERWGFYSVIIFIGIISGILGIGGGSLIVPFLTRHNISLRQAVGLSAAIGLVTAIVGSLGMIIMGWYEPNLRPFSLGFVYIPAVFAIIVPSFLGVKGGVWLSYRLPVKRLKQLFGIILLITSIFLVWR